MSETARYEMSMYTVSGEGQLIPARFHAVSMEIVTVLSGEVSFHIGTDTVEAVEGDFVYVPPKTVVRAEARGSASVRGAIFDTYLIEADMEHFDTEILYMFYVQSENRITLFRQGHPAYAALSRAMREMYEEYAAKDVCYRLPMRANLCLMVTALLRFYCGSRDESDRMVYHNVLRLRPVLSYIASHCDGKIYMESLAEMIHVSPDYFTRMFRDSIGKTPVDYINRLRVGRALQLLVETDDPLASIAEQVGFCNGNYFHKIFKQYMGESPLAFRHRARG